MSIGRQTGVSISLKGDIARLPAPAIRGRLSAAAALRQLARASNLHVKAVSDRAYILSAVPAAAPVRRLAQVTPSARRVIDSIPEPAPHQDIIVTASKRDTPLQRFAGQWTRIDGDRFSPFGIVGTEAIEAQTVGFTSTHLGAGRNKLFIRGIADSSFSGPTQSPVGQYLGDLRTGYNGADPDLRLVDMDSVEVMEGPQGTLYGAGALGGILLLKPNRPNLKDSQVTASVGSSLTQHGDPGYDLASTINLPIADSAGVRLTGYRAVDGGYIDNRLTGEHDVNRVGVTGGRLLAAVDVAPEWQIELTATAQRIKGRDSQYADDHDDGLSRSSAVDQPFDSRFKLASLVLRKDIGDIRFRSTLGATWQDVDERFDASMDGRTRALTQHSKGRQISSETRIWRPMKNGWSWLFGVSRLENRYDVQRKVVEDGEVTDLSGVLNRLSETTAYGELGFAFTDRIEGTIGGRYTMADLRGSGEHLSPLAFAAVRAIKPEREERRLLPSASLLARPVDGVTIYARYQQGFRPGGLSIASDTVRYFRRDLLGTTEVGFRFGKPRSDRVDLAGSITHSRWDNIQADYLDASGLPVTDNIGDGRIWTAALNGGYRLAPGLRIEAGTVFNDGKITRPSPAYQILMAAARDAGIAQSDEISMRIPNIARWVGRVGIDWSHHVSGDWTLNANAYARYIGHSRLGVGAKLGERQGNYFDSGLALRINDGRKGVSLSIINLTDSVGNRFAFGAPVLEGENQLTPLRPRTVRLGFDWSL